MRGSDPCKKVKEKGMKMFRTISLCVLCLVALLPGIACADASYFGYTGLIFTPTAEALSLGRYNATGVVVNYDNDVDATFVGGNVGITKALEVGAAWLDSDPGDSDVIVNAKWQVLAESETQPAFAVGFADIADEIDATPYAVVTKSLNWLGTGLRAPKISVGVGDGILDGLFAGLSVFAGDRTELMVEYDTDDVNFGARFNLTEQLKINAALLDGDDFAAGLSFNIGF